VWKRFSDLGTGGPHFGRTNQVPGKVERQVSGEVPPHDDGTRNRPSTHRGEPL
jgi:hypothetical protein